MNWYCVSCCHHGLTPWNPEKETNLKKNDNATTGAYKTKQFVLNKTCQIPFQKNPGFQNLVLRKWSQIVNNIPPLIETDPSAIKLFPIAIRLNKSVLKPLILDLIVFDSVRDECKTQEMCNKALSYAKILSW